MTTWYPIRSSRSADIAASIHGQSPMRTYTIQGTRDVTAAQLTTAPVTLWSGAATQYPWLDDEATLEVVSTAAEDGPGGTGADTVRVLALRTDGTEVDQLVALQGTTPVALPGGPFYRVNLLETYHSGTGRRNTGTVQVRVTGGGAILANLAPGLSGPAKQFIFTIPLGFYGVLGTYLLTVTTGNNQAPDAGDTARLVQMAQFRGPDVVGGSNTWSHVIEYGVNQNTGTLPVTPVPSPQAWPPGTDIEMQVAAVTDTGTVRCGAAMNITLVPVSAGFFYPGAL